MLWSVQEVLFRLLGHSTYVVMVGLLGCAGLGVPISQDLVLLIGGVLASRGVTQLGLTMAAAFVGVLLGDSLMYRWGRRLGPRAFVQPWVLRVLTPEREAKLRDHFARRGALTIIAARHTPVVRGPIFFLAGASGLRYRTFLLADAASAALTVPLWVWLGSKAGEHLDELRKRIANFEWIAAGAVAIVILVVILVRRRRGPPLTDRIE